MLVSGDVLLGLLDEIDKIVVVGVKLSLPPPLTLRRIRPFMYGVGNAGPNPRRICYLRVGIGGGPSAHRTVC